MASFHDKGTGPNMGLKSSTCTYFGFGIPCSVSIHKVDLVLERDQRKSGNDPTSDVRG